MDVGTAAEGHSRGDRTFPDPFDDQNRVRWTESMLDCQSTRGDRRHHTPGEQSGDRHQSSAGEETQTST
ncbi:unnamed protein product [Didymodactylos carnosus]|uniref:Uncharacterized protein n=1 Tax=Didymodactylos carnosus TaxID=1234261 RepID=A0A815EKV6_9BILA|nr:unnamed protein product [Didymodactylos carnosus]CAF4151899.1 unnamed protein product [Didymodactylos carnosus]